MNTKQTIAIVGMAGKFPTANNLDEFWKLLVHGESTITEMPKTRWDLDKFYDPDPSTPNKSYQKHGSFLENIDDFDPLLFNISPAEAIEMSPSQKLILELTWEAIENNDLAFEDIAGKKGGVYIGNIWSDFEHFRKHLNANTTSHSAVGQSANIIANRVSYTFGFTGPSLVVDTGCSSSLVALHLACQSLWEGSSDLSVVGGINHILDHDQYVLLSKFGGLSEKGRCSTFSDEVDGFVRGEGAGVVILKRLSDAEADGDNILAVVRGSAMSNNGFNVNLPATSIKGQLDVLEAAYRDSGIDPASVHYLEAHGTGTKLGDPTETKAIGTFFSKNRKNDLPLKIGSVKTNIGHLEGAAGMAGLLKVLLALQHKQLPASLHFNKPNPKIPFEALKLEVNNKLAHWQVEEGCTRKAGINSFGWGGTNAHTLLEEYIPSSNKTDVSLDVSTHLLCLSAKNEQALKAYANKYAEQLAYESTPEAVAQICIATAINKPKLPYRASVVGNNTDELIQRLRELIEDENPIQPPKLRGDEKIVFVFPGQGSQWLGMGRELYAAEPIFQQAMDACDHAFAPHADWSLTEQLFADEHGSRLSEINVVQPFLFAVEVALAKLWMSKGISPDAVVGHSMGEVASAHISGAISLDDAANIICSRSKLMKTVSNTGGAMAVTELTMQEAERVVARFGGKLSVAVSNSPKSTVIAGDETALLEVLEALETQGLFARQVKVDVASHSSQMDPLMPLLQQHISGMKAQKSSIPYYSTVLNKQMEGSELTEEYWVGNLRGMVCFSDVVSSLMDTEHLVFIEMSPHPVLTNAINECAEVQQKQVSTIASLFREKPEKPSFLSNVGRLFEQGYAIDWKRFYHLKRAPRKKLPGYPMQKQTYALEDRAAQKSSGTVQGKNPLLGRRIHLAGIDNTFIWENKLSLEHLSFAKDHKVNDAAVLPGVSYLEILYAALQDAFGNAFHQVEGLHFKAPVYLQEHEAVDTQLKIVRTGQHTASFIYYIKSSSGHDFEWIVSAEGKLKVCISRERIPNDYLSDLNRSDSDTVIKKEDFYKLTDAIGIQYGNLFQGINWIRINNRQAIAHVVPNARIAQHDHKYFIHPAILDSCFQTIFTPVQASSDKQANYTTFLSELKGFRWFNKPEKGDDILVKAELKQSISEPNGITRQQVALEIYDESGNFLADLELLEAVIINNRKLGENNSEQWLYKTHWDQVTIDAAEHGDQQETWVIFEDHLGIAKKLNQLFEAKSNKLIRVGFGHEFIRIDEDQYCVNYRDPQSIGELLAHLTHDNVLIDGIIHAAALNDHIFYESLGTAELEHLQNDSSILLINLHKALMQQDAHELPKLVVLTNGLLPVAQKSTGLNLAQAPMWGLAKVLFNEQVAYHCRRVDMSYFPDDPEVYKLYDLIFKEKIDEPELAVRDEQTYASRLITEAIPPFNLEEVKFATDGTVVVTGFKGAAFPLVEWMIERGASRIALLSRSGKAGNEVLQTIEHYRKVGLNIQIYTVDVAEHGQLQKVFERIGQEMPPIKGIVHAAGLICANRISDVSEEEFFKILAPKMKGTWNLHRLSLDLPIEHFILFSSASSLIGLSGQGSYVAANTFIDYFAHFRSKLGLPATAINWGVIGDVGMVANEQELDKYSRAEGFIPFEMKKGVQILNKIYTNALVQTGITLLNIDKTTEYYSALADTNYFKKLSASSDSEQGRQEQLDIAKMDEKEALAKLEMLISQKVAGITKASMSIISSGTTFKGLGIDSLMAIQLRNQLEKSLGIKLAVGNFWKHPSIGQFAQFSHTMLRKDISKNPDTPAAWWISHSKGQPQAFLYCFHDAGGSSTLYDNWDALDPSIELRAVELPGRGTRVDESFITDMQALVERLASEIHHQSNYLPFAFFGHSMGGAVAYEVMKVLRQRNQPVPLALFTSSTPALFTYNRAEVSNRLSDEELIKRYPHLSTEQIGDEALRQSFMGMMRSDLQLLDSYHYQKDAPFHIPIVSLRGLEDDGVSLEQITQWGQETLSSHEVIERPGGHRYLANDAAFASQLINHKLLSFIESHKQVLK